MTEKWKDEAWAQDIWYRGKVTRRTLVGWGGGAIGAMMLVPAPWRAAFGAAAPYKIGSLQPLSGAAALGGKTAVVGLQMAIDRINTAGGVNGRPLEAIIADDESKPDVGRRKTQKLLGRRQCRRACRRLPVQHLPRLHAGVRGKQGRQHDQRVPRHHADHHQVQSLQLPYLRICAVAGGGDRALSGQQDGQEVAHRLCRLFVGPIDARRLCGGDQEAGRRGGRHHRHSARHRRHDAVPVEDQRRSSTGCSASSSARTASPSAIRRSTSASPRSTSGRATVPSPNPPTCPRSAARSKASSVSIATFRSSKARSTPRRCVSSSTKPRRGSPRSIRPARCPIATCSRTMSRSTRSSSAWRSRSSRAARTP